MNSRIALGTAQFGMAYGIANQGGQVRRQEASEILSQCLLAGLDTLDTAMGYGDCEQRLGEIGVEEWCIISKLPAFPDSCPDPSGWAREMVSASLSRLRVTRLYGLLLHCPQQLMGPNGHALFSAIDDLKQDGLVEKIGISIYSPQELDDLLPSYGFEIVQAPLNVLDNRLITSGWLARLKDAQIEVHARSVFLQGLLLMADADRPERFRKWQHHWGMFDEWRAGSGLSALQACVGYVLSNPHLDRIVAGVETLSQMREILSVSVADFPPLPVGLSSEDLDLINPSRWNA